MNQQMKMLQITSSFRLDFNLLAINSAKDLWKHIIILEGKITIDFMNQKSLIALTQSIMNLIFDLKWFMNQNGLCPRIPNRVNYLMWIHKYIQSLLSNNYLNLKDSINNNEVILKNKDYLINSVTKNVQFNVLDIGTGSSLIYPLIGHKIFGWSFIATQICQNSINNCKKLIQINDLQNKIQIRKSNPKFILRQVIQHNQQISCVICNPPFFDKQGDYLQPLSKMHTNEHNTMGGQYEFFFNLYLQSFYYPSIQYFTMLIGRQTDFDLIKQFLIKQKRQYETVQIINFGKINQGTNARFIICWKINQKQVKLILNQQSKSIKQ